MDKNEKRIAELEAEIRRLTGILAACDEVIEVLKASNISARAERDSLREVVADLEWGGIAHVGGPADTDPDVEIDCCPICGACKEGSVAGDGVHVEDCALRAALGGSDGK